MDRESRENSSRTEKRVELRKREQREKETSIYSRQREERGSKVTTHREDRNERKKSGAERL
jgi:hypothetical protein